MHNKKKGKSKINYSIENKKCAKNIKNQYWLPWKQKNKLILSKNYF